LTALYLAGSKNTDSWHASWGDLQRASPLDAPMVPASSTTITADDECLPCNGFYLSEPICLGNFEFIAIYFGGLSQSPRRGNEAAIFMGSTCSRVSTP
jgi:hypothetical protein